jgi:hypothetical protein
VRLLRAFVGDVRALLQYAILALNHGISAFKGRLEDGKRPCCTVLAVSIANPISLSLVFSVCASVAIDANVQLVTLGIVQGLNKATDDILANVNGLTDYPRLLLASLFLYPHYCGSEGWRINSMMNAFRDLLEQKGLGDGECQNFRTHLAQVVGYKLMERTDRGGSPDVSRVSQRLSLKVHCSLCLSAMTDH